MASELPVSIKCSWASLKFDCISLSLITVFPLFSLFLFSSRLIFLIISKEISLYLLKVSDNKFESATISLKLGVVPKNTPKITT